MAYKLTTHEEHPCFDEMRATGKGKKADCHGELQEDNSIIRGIHKNDLLNLSAIQKKEFIHLKTVSDRFPEYFILKVTGLNDIAKNSLDKWIYFLKILK